VTTEPIIRPAEPADLADVQAIYAVEVLEGTASFELEPPDRAELLARLGAVRQARLPWLVLESEGRVRAYAYAALYRTRPAYRHTAEDSVYVARDARGRGFGRMLLERLIGECGTAGYRELVAIIGDSANVGSIRLHAACGFRHVGTLENVGLKFGRWLDTVLMQRSLGA
jgi:L-amino acid N-acyltransferase YncA